MAILAIAVATVHGVGGDAPGTGPIPDDACVFRYLTAQESDAVAGTLKDWKSARIDRKLALAQELLAQLPKGGSGKLKGYTWKEGTHDLETKAGRAAAGIDALVGTRLKPVTRESSAADLKTTRAMASASIETLRAKAIAKAKTRREGPSVAELKTAFGNKIRPGISMKHAERSSREMNSLLGKWSPIGRPVAELEGIVGTPGARAKDHVSYRFDNGYGGTEFKFRVQDGVITSLRILGLD